jgi:tetratricopeptide (TPR) repeat protein
LLPALKYLALALREQGRFTEAEGLLQRLIAIEEKTPGFQDVALASALSALGDTYRDDGRLPQAETCYQRSLAISEQRSGDVDPAMATALLNYAALLRKLQREREALRLEDRARVILASRKPPAGDVSMPTNSLR